MKQVDREITVTMKMSEANFIISALAGVKFRADDLINKIVEQGNPQLPKPNSELPVGISEEVDDKILALFSEEWNQKENNLEFDFSKPGHVVAVCKFDGAKADKLLQRIAQSEIADSEDLQLTVNREIEGSTVIVFSKIVRDTAEGTAYVPTPEGDKEAPVETAASANTDRKKK